MKILYSAGKPAAPKASNTRFLRQQFIYLKGTVSEILSYSLFKDGNSRFTTIPLKTLADQVL